MEENKMIPFAQPIQIDNTNNFASDNFESKLSHGANPKKLAQLVATYKSVMSILGWEDKLTDTIVGLQASIDSQYHKDFVRIAELEHYVNTLRKSRSNSPSGFYSNNPQIDNAQTRQ